MSAVSYLVSEGGICEFEQEWGILRFVDGMDEDRNEKRILARDERSDRLSDYLLRSWDYERFPGVVIVFLMVMRQGVFMTAVDVGKSGAQVMQQFYGPDDRLGEIVSSVDAFAGRDGRRFFLIPSKHTRLRLPEDHLGRLCCTERIRCLSPDASCVSMDRLTEMIMARTGRRLGRDVMRRLEHMRLGVSSLASSRSDRCVEDGLLCHAARNDALDVLRTFCYVSKKNC